MRPAGKLVSHCNYVDSYKIWCVVCGECLSSSSLQHLDYSIEVLECAVLDDDFALALSVANTHPHAQDPLQFRLRRAHVGVNILGCFGLIALHSWHIDVEDHILEL